MQYRTPIVLYIIALCSVACVADPLNDRLKSVYHIPQQEALPAKPLSKLFPGREEAVQMITQVIDHKRGSVTIREILREEVAKEDGKYIEPVLSGGARYAMPLFCVQILHTGGMVLETDERLLVRSLASDGPIRINAIEGGIEVVCPDLELYEVLTIGVVGDSEAGTRHLIREGAPFLQIADNERYHAGRRKILVKRGSDL